MDEEVFNRIARNVASLLLCFCPLPPQGGVIATDAQVAFVEGLMRSWGVDIQLKKPYKLPGE